MHKLGYIYYHTYINIFINKNIYLSDTNYPYYLNFWVNFTSCKSELK